LLLIIILNKLLTYNLKEEKMRKSKLAFLLVAIAVITMAITGCGGKGENVGAPATGDNILRLVTNDEQTTCDVQKTTEYYTIPLNIFERLVETQTNLDGTSELVPGLAERCQIPQR
jgi:ABC-type transport system substrate-binding protein